MAVSTELFFLNRAKTLEYLNCERNLPKLITNPNQRNLIRIFLDRNKLICISTLFCVWQPE